MTYPSSDGVLGAVRPREAGQRPDQHDAADWADAAHALGLQPWSDFLGVFAGGTGEKIGQRTYALGVQAGLQLNCLFIDNDFQELQGIRVPGGATIRVPSASQVRLGAGYTRQRVLDDPLLRQRYAGDTGLFRGIPVYTSWNEAGKGGHGYPPIAAADYDLSAREVFRTLRSAVRTLGQTVSLDALRGNPLVGWATGSSDAAAPRPKPLVVIVGSGPGSPGHAGHLLLPGILRQLMADLGQPMPTVVGLVTGPSAYRGLHERVEANFLALLAQLREQTEHGIHWEFPYGMTVDLAMPPYDYIWLADQVDADPDTPATDAEIRELCDRLARELFALITSTVPGQLAGTLANQVQAPFMNLRAATARVDWDELARQAAGRRAAARLARLTED